MTDYATVDDLAAAWRPLTAAEEVRADALLARASRMILRRWSDVDERIAAGDLHAADVADVVLEMVQSAMSSPAPGVEQYSENVGPFGGSVKYANPMGRLFFTAEMVRVFEGTPATVRQAWLA